VRRRDVVFDPELRARISRHVSRNDRKSVSQRTCGHRGFLITNFADSIAIFDGFGDTVFRNSKEIKLGDKGNLDIAKRGHLCFRTESRVEVISLNEMIVGISVKNRKNQDRNTHEEENEDEGNGI